MSVTVAKTAGFCWGVRRAVDRVMTTIKKGQPPFRVYGPLVHNPQVIHALRDRGVATCDEPWSQSGGTLFLRTHGVTSEDRRGLVSLELTLCDLTCPRVGRAISIAKKRAVSGHDVIIFGDLGHHEVKAILSAAGRSGRVISSPSEAMHLPDLTNPFLLSQTTQNQVEFGEVLDILRKRWPLLEHEDTICGSTGRRQRELRELMGKADAVVIVGGRNSANTQRLAHIAGETGLPVFRVETQDELVPEDLCGYRRILVSAGASTPGWSIRKVRERLLEIQGLSSRSGWVRTALRGLVFSGAHIPVIALLLALAQGVTLGGAGWGRAGLAAGLLLWAFTGFTAVLECRRVTITSQKRQEFIIANERWMMLLAALAFIGAMVLSAGLGRTWLLWTLSASAACLLYAAPLVRDNGMLDFLRRIPGSREVLFTLAWSLLVCVIPAVTLAGIDFGFKLLAWPLSLAFLFFARSLLIDLVDLQGDALLGMDTLPLHLGAGRCRDIFLFTAAAAGITQIGAALSGTLPWCVYGFAAAPLLLVVGFLFIERLSFPSELAVRIVADGSLLLGGAVPLLLCSLFGAL